MVPSSAAIEHTLTIAEQALELIRRHGPSASPRSYEVWYSYVSGCGPLREAVLRLIAERGQLREDDIDRLYDSHLAHGRLTAEAERTSTNLILEIDEVMKAIGVALGSTAQYGRSLETSLTDLAGPVDQARFRQIVGSLLNATKEVASTNTSLEERLNETRGELDTVRTALETVRMETITDPLTGISNRKHFEEMLAKAVQRGAVGEPTALIVIDIDHFKRFNDTYGHLTGDQVLRLVGSVMREHVKVEATLARFGGEEFGIVLPGTTLGAAHGIAEGIRVSVLNRKLVKRSTGESLGRVTLSVGVACCRADDTPTSFLERADQCMFSAKRSGRNRTVTEPDPSGSTLPDVA